MAEEKKVEQQVKKQHVEDETTDDLRVARYEPLVQPMKLVEEIPSTKESRETVRKGRLQAAACLKGTDDRLLVIVGPCSIHDVDLAIDYGIYLKFYIKRKYVIIYLFKHFLIF